MRRALWGRFNATGSSQRWELSSTFETFLLFSFVSFAANFIDIYQAIHTFNG